MKERKVGLLEPSGPLQACNGTALPYTGCNRRNGPDFGRVFLMLNYTEKPQNTKFNGYGDIGQRKVWTSVVSAYCDVILSVSGGWARATTVAFPRYR